jgi:hypothetical protein
MCHIKTGLFLLVVSLTAIAQDTAFATTRKALNIVL